MKGKSTHINRMRTETALVKQRVQELLGWDDHQYGAFQEKMGLSYLDYHYGHAPLISRIPMHKEFWTWWRLHWLRRDREFVEMSSMVFSEEMEGYYRDQHDPAVIVHTPQGVILKNTYSTMIHELVKKATAPAPLVKKPKKERKKGNLEEVWIPFINRNDNQR